MDLSNSSFPVLPCTLLVWAVTLVTLLLIWIFLRSSFLYSGMVQAKLPDSPGNAIVSLKRQTTEPFKKFPPLPSPRQFLYSPDSLSQSLYCPDGHRQSLSSPGIVYTKLPDSTGNGMLPRHRLTKQPVQVCPPPLPSHSQSLFSCDSEILQSSTDRMFLDSVYVEVCTKAKDAFNHPSYVPLCLTLIEHYGLDINAPILTHGLTIFHCVCLSGSLELISSLSSLADINILTELGESALYLSVYAAVHRSSAGECNQQCLSVVGFLLELGCDVNYSHETGMTCAHLASSQGCHFLARMLMDWRADPNISSPLALEHCTERVTPPKRGVVTRSRQKVKTKF